MYWQKRFDREDPDNAIVEEIKKIRKIYPNFGYRSLTMELKNLGMKVNCKKIHRISKKFCLQITTFGRKSGKYNSYRGDLGHYAPNRLNQNFDSTIPRQKITTDTTEFRYNVIDKNGKTVEEKLYLDPYMDLFNREIISFQITSQPNGISVLKGLEEAIKASADCQYRRTFHSDRGWAYKMKDYTRRLKEEKIFQSMSRKGNCYDNAVMENFFGIMKQEIYHGRTFNSFEELETAITEYIYFYNHDRRKIKLGWKSPVDYYRDYQEKDLLTSNNNGKTA